MWSSGATKALDKMLQRPVLMVRWVLMQQRGRRVVGHAVDHHAVLVLGGRVRGQVGLRAFTSVGAIFCDVHRLDDHWFGQVPKARDLFLRPCFNNSV
jgi:hypothetical protein